MNVSEELIREIVQKVLAEAKQQESGEDFVKEKDRNTNFITYRPICLLIR